MEAARHEEQLDESEKSRERIQNRPIQASQELQNDDEVLALHTDTDEEWITNNVYAEAVRRKTKNNPPKKYSTLEMCLLGVERIIAHTRREEFEYMTLGGIESQIKLLQMYYSKFFEATVITDSISAEEIVSRSDLIERFEQRYDEVMAVLINRSKSINSEYAAVHNSTVTSSESSNQQAIKVKKVDIEKFNGDMGKWPQFKSTFEECFHKRTDIAGALKFYHLMSHLEPNSEPYEALNVFDRTDANYSTAWKTLCEMYDNERKLVNNIVLSFVDMPAISEVPSRSELISIIIKTNHLTQSLPKYGVDVKSWDPILVPLLLRKLDGESICCGHWNGINDKSQGSSRC